MTQPHDDRGSMPATRYGSAITRGGFRYLFKRPIPKWLRRSVAEHEYRDNASRGMAGKRILQRLNLQDLDTWQRRRLDQANTIHQLGQKLRGGPKIRRLNQPWTAGATGGITSTTPHLPADQVGKLRSHRFSKIEPFRPSTPDRSWKVPTGRREPFPKIINRYPQGNRQSWLRSYYHANPMAAQQARSQARTIINWAHKHLR